MYKGGKNGSGTYQTIINQIPVHTIYCELFAGSAGIYLKKIPADISILCEKSLKQCELLSNIVLPNTTVLNCDTVLNVDIFITFFNLLHSLQHRVFLYLDPPYPISSRSCQRNIYEHEMSDGDHIALLSAIRKAKFPIAISTYPNKIYFKSLFDWRLLKFQSVTRTGTATEFLYMNYPEPSHLHDYRYFGTSFRQREKYNRIKQNFLKKLDSFPVQFQNSIINDIASSSFSVGDEKQ